MYIHRVVLRNIKGLSLAELDFTADSMPGWSVITGDNGSGKTAILRAIALAVLGPEQSRGLVQDFRGWVRHGEALGTVSVEIAPHHEVDKTYRGGYPVQGTFWAEVAISRGDSGGPTAHREIWEMEATDVYRKKKKGAFNGPWESTTPGWFMLGYGPFRRMYGSSPDAQRLMVIPGRIPHFATLFKEDATLAEGEEWIKQLSFKKLEARQQEASILDGLLKFIASDFLRAGLKIDGADSEGLWLRDAHGMRMTLLDMSEGYRSGLAMLIDTFRHMVDVYGIDGLLDDIGEGKWVVSKPGIVMIDEVDAHLHPSWQRTIGFWLREHFPKVQFIVTSHSPLVCQAADGGRIYHLPDLESATPPFKLSEVDFFNVIVGRPDQILLTPAFQMDNTRSPRAVAARKRRAQLASKQLSMDLSPAERAEFEQLSLFAVSTSEDGSDR